ncbi:MAG TPA: right-handed parallel beta-helix repeat-containing protein, partial [Polyangiaceae bacterium]
ARYIGLGVGKFGVNGSDLTSGTVSGNVVVRCGGNAYMQQQPALHIGNGGDGQGVGIVSGVTVQNNTIKNSLYDAVGFSTSTNITLKDNTIDTPGLNGIVIDPQFYPAPTGSATITGNQVLNLGAAHTAYSNLSQGFMAMLSGNSWQ